MSDHGNPLKKKKEVKEEVIKPEKKVLPGSVVKALLGWKGVAGDSLRLWVERWLVQLVRERSLPPQIAGSDVMAALDQFLTPSDALDVLAKIRLDFQREHPALHQTDDFAFLLKAFADEGMPPYDRIL